MVKGGFYSRVPVGARLNEIGMVGARTRHLGKGQVVEITLADGSVATAKIIDEAATAAKSPTGWNSWGTLIDAEVITSGGSFVGSNTLVGLGANPILNHPVQTVLTVTVDSSAWPDNFGDVVEIEWVPSTTGIDVIARNNDSVSRTVTVTGSYLTWTS